jgi:allophanate hydrolase
MALAWRYGRSAACTTATRNDTRPPVLISPHMQNSFEPSIRSLVRKAVTGELHPLTIADEVLHRLEKHRENPIFISTTPPEKLRQRAADLAELSAEERGKLPLYGVPFAVKDNIDVAGVPTTAGCPEFAFVPQTTAFVVEKLLAAGGILVGKCNLDQFATGLTGMRSVYGSPINPYSPDHITGGSSSGSAVAVSCGIVNFSLGTDTAGSGRIPAGFNGIVGFRPSSGVLSSSGVVPCAKSLDTVSVFGNCADDVRRVLAVAAGFDAADPFSAELNPRPLPINGPVIGVLEPADDHFLGDQQARAAYERGVDRLRALGYATTTIDYRPFREISDMTYFGPSMAERTAVLGEFIKATPGATYTAVVRDAIVKAATFSAVDAFRMLHRLKELERTIDLDTWRRADLLCIPTAPTIYTRDQVRKDPAYASTSLGCYTNFAPFLGLPAVSVPNGFRQDGMPTGMMFVGQRASDMAVLQISEIFAS